MALDQLKVREMIDKGGPFPELVSNHQESVPYLIDMLGDTSPSSEIKSLQTYPSHPRSSFRLFPSDDRIDFVVPVSEQAMKALKLIGENAVPALIEALSHQDEIIRDNAKSVLITLASGYFVNDPVNGPSKRFISISLYEVFCSLQSFIGRTISSGDADSIARAREEARSCYIEIASAAKRNKRRMFQDGEILEGTIKPPNGSRNDGMFRNVPGSNPRKTGCCE